MKIVPSQSPWVIYCGNILVDIDDWQITFFIDCGELDYCDCCTAPGGRVGTFEDWQRYGTDPVLLLSRWGHQQLEQRLQTLGSESWREGNSSE